MTPSPPATPPLRHQGPSTSPARQRGRRRPESRVLRFTDNGHLVLTLTDGAAQLSVMPHFGAKVIELIDLIRGQQWLAAPVRPRRDPQPADRWEDHDRSGWDECFPNISPGPHPQRSVSLPDHGEVWSRPWQHRIRNDSAVQTSIDGGVLPYRLTRTLRLHDHGVTVDYQLRNLSRDAYAVTWTMHPLLAVTAGTRLLLPAATEVAHDPEALPTSGVAAERRTPWTAIQPRSFSAVPSGSAAKLYTRPDGSTAAIVERPQAALRFLLHADPPGAFGLWLNDGGWPAADPQRHLAVEPTLGAADRLDRAISQRTAMQLPGDGSRQWQVTIDFLDPSPDTTAARNRDQHRNFPDLGRTPIEEQR